MLPSARPQWPREEAGARPLRIGCPDSVCQAEAWRFAWRRPRATSNPTRSSRSAGGRRLPDLFDLLVLVLFVLLSLWTVFVLLSQQGSDHIWTGTNGPYIGDQMQYLGWIHSSYHHILAGNPFESSGGIRDYLNPALVISGLLVVLGVSTSVSYLVWTPVAAILLGVATWFYIRRTLSKTASRRIALVLALFYLSPLPLVASHLHWNVLYVNSYSFEMWPAYYLWGYPFTALSVAFLIGCLLTLTRARDGGKFGWASPICALFCAWLQPWQGATLLLVVAGCEIYARRRGLSKTRRSLLVATVTAALVPLLYYFLLSRFDATWRLSGQVNGHTEPAWDLVLSLAPLGHSWCGCLRTSALRFCGPDGVRMADRFSCCVLCDRSDSWNIS